MILSKATLPDIAASTVQKPAKELLNLPEKVLQFGTGVLLRGLPDFFIDKANKQGVFNGTVVVVKSTDSGGADAFDKQDGFYTICVQGIDKGKKVEENIIAGAISRVLSVRQHWKDILQTAYNPEMQIIISNTTEVGITLLEEDIHQQPPASFPPKLLAFLYERYKACQGSAEGGMIVIPTELIVGNGDKLLTIVLQLAAYNKLDAAFTDWLKSHNHFCNSLVDRIVPGKPDAAAKSAIEAALGYQDDLLIMCEVYRLWAIEGDEKVKQVLSFAKCDDGVIIAPDIEMYRELKLRLLNGTHTLSCGLAFLSGFQTVKEAMADPLFGSFVQDIMLHEIAPAIPAKVDPVTAEQFGMQVLDRFRNPFINHQWISITMQYSSKMKMRVIPVLLKYYTEFNKTPAGIAKGFAAFLAFMKPVKKDGNVFYGERNGQHYPINDDNAAYFYEQWQKHEVSGLVPAVLSDLTLWGTDLTKLPGFAGAVSDNMLQITKK